MNVKPRARGPGGEGEGELGTRSPVFGAQEVHEGSETPGPRGGWSIFSLAQ